MGKPIICVTVPEKARREIAECSRDKLQGLAVAHYVKLFAPINKRVKR